MLWRQLRNMIACTYKSILLLTLLLLVVVPVALRMQLINHSVAVMDNFLQEYYQFFYGAGCIFLFICLLYPYVQGEGRELLYVYYGVPWVELSFLFILLSVELYISVFFWWGSVLSKPFQFYLKNEIIIFFFIAVCYCFLYLFNSIMVMTILAVAVLVITMVNPFHVLETMQYNMEINTNLELIYFMKEYIVIGIILMLGGICFNKRYCKYTV